MGRGAPDYKNPLYSIAAASIDLSLVATLLLGCAPTDTRGRAWWVDNFINGLSAWYNSATGDAVAFASDGSVSFSPPYSAKGGTGTLALGGLCDLFMQRIIYTEMKVGIETAINYRSNAGIYDIQFMYDDGEYAYYGRLRINPVTGVVEVRTPTGYETVVTLPAATDDDTWMPIKMVMDFTTNSYVRVMLGQVEYNLSALSLGQTAHYATGYLALDLRGFPIDATERFVWYGYAIITVDEP